MKKIDFIDFIEILIVVLVIAMFIVLLVIARNEEKNKTEEYQQCEHEFVTTSELSLLSKSNYRVVSKCIKCGYTIR